MGEVQTCRICHSSLRGQCGVSSHTEALGVLGRRCHVVIAVKRFHTGQKRLRGGKKLWQGLNLKLQGHSPTTASLKFSAHLLLWQHSEPRKTWCNSTKSVTSSVCRNMCMVTGSGSSPASPSSVITISQSLPCQNTDLHKQMNYRNKIEGVSGV